MLPFGPDELNKSSSNVFQEGIPVRLKEMHIINSVAFVDTFLAAMRPLGNASFFNKVRNSRDV